MHEFSTFDAKNKFSALLDLVEKGEEVVHIHSESSFIVNQEKQQITQRPKLDINQQG